jgi:hypothetical protein
MRKKSRDIWIAPNQCPGLKKCVHCLGWDVFQAMCLTESWIYCEHADAMSRKYKKLPYEWLLAYKLGGFPKEKIKVP